MKRRQFLTSSIAGLGGAVASRFTARASSESGDAPQHSPASATRKILISGGSYDTAWVRYMAALTGRSRPKLLFLPTASADSQSNVIAWYRTCSTLNVEPQDQSSFISSGSQKRGWDEVLLSVDGIVVSGGNTLNQQAIWKAQGVDVVLRQAWDRGIVLGGGSAGSVCWFEEGPSDSRPKALSIVQCLGFLKGSHCPHYDRDRRLLYMKLIESGQLKPGYACSDNSGIYFEDNAIKRVVTTKAGVKVYHVSLVGGKAVEEVFEPELIS